MNRRQTITATILLLMSFSSAHASDVLAVLKNPTTVYVTDAKTGTFKCSIPVSHAVAVGCDGTTVAVLLSNGSLNRYDGQTGRFLGASQTGPKATAVQVSGGVVAVTLDHKIQRYDAKSGRFLGSNQF
jgi:WD40 repeat protein